MARGLLVVLAAVLLGAAGSETYAAFSARSQNQGNVFRAASSFCSSSTQTASASADSYVDGLPLAQGSNFGTATTMSVQSAALANRRTLVRFGLPTAPAYCSLTAATLRLNASSSASGRTLQAFRASSSWTETGVTWSNAPATTGSASSTASGTGWREWDVTAQVQAMYAGTNNGFLVRDATEDATLPAGQTFSSREGVNPPQLVLSFG